MQCSYCCALLLVSTLGATAQLLFPGTSEHVSLLSSAGICIQDGAISGFPPREVLVYSRQPEGFSIGQKVCHRCRNQLCCERPGSSARVQAQRRRTLLAHPLVLPETRLAQGLSNLGNPHSLQRAMQKLISGVCPVSLQQEIVQAAVCVLSCSRACAGQAIHLVVLGTSITDGHHTSPTDTWPRRLFNWIEATFPHPTTVC